MIVLAILCIIAAIIFTSFATFAKSQSLDKDTDGVVEMIRKARTMTLNSQYASQYGVRFASSTVTLFPGSAYTASTSNQTVYLSSNTKISALSLTGNTTDIIFQRLTGETSQNGTITVSSTQSGRSHIITVYKTGVVEVK